MRRNTWTAWLLPAVLVFAFGLPAGELPLTRPASSVQTGLAAPASYGSPQADDRPAGQDFDCPGVRDHDRSLDAGHSRIPRRHPAALLRRHSVGSLSGPVDTGLPTGRPRAVGDDTPGGCARASAPPHRQAGNELLELLQVRRR